MDTLAKHQRCVGMAGIVKAVTLEAGETHYFFEGTTEPPRKDRRAITIAEYGTIVVDRIPLQQPISFLALPECAEHQCR